MSLCRGVLGVFLGVLCTNNTLHGPCVMAEGTGTEAPLVQQTCRHNDRCWWVASSVLLGQGCQL